MITFFVYRVVDVLLSFKHIVLLKFRLPCGEKFTTFLAHNFVAYFLLANASYIFVHSYDFQTQNFLAHVPLKIVFFFTVVLCSLYSLLAEKLA